jgi:hypothetical protein
MLPPHRSKGNEKPAKMIQTAFKFVDLTDNTWTPSHPAPQRHPIRFSLENEECSPHQMQLQPQAPSVISVVLPPAAVVLMLTTRSASIR